MSQERIAKAAGIILAATMLSKIFGVVRERVIAAYFGASNVTDAYLVALTIPTILITLFTEGVTAGFLPVFTSLLARQKKDEAGTVAGSVFFFATVLLALVSLAGTMLTPWLIPLAAPGFTPATAAVAVYLSRLLFPAVFFMGLAAVLTAALQSFQHFTAPAFAPLAMNVTTVLVISFLSRRLGPASLALGTVAGMAVQCVLQLPVLLRYLHTRAVRSALSLRHPDVAAVGRLGAPVIGRSLVMQGYTLIERVLASGLTAGSIAALNFANKLMLLTPSVFATAITTAIFPTLAEQAAREEKEAMADTLLQGIRLTALVILPATVGIIVLRAPIVRLVFEQGAFDAAATRSTALALLYYSLGMPGQAGNLLLTRAYFALHDTVTPLKLSFLSTGITILAAFLLVRPLQHGGLALANSGGVLAAMVLLYWLLRRKLPQLDNGALMRSLGKIGLAAGAMGAGLAALVQSPLGISIASLGNLTGTVLLIGTGGVVYFLALVLLRVEELALVGRILGRRLNRRA